MNWTWNSKVKAVVCRHCDQIWGFQQWKELWQLWFETYSRNLFLLHVSNLWESTSKQHVYQRSVLLLPHFTVVSAPKMPVALFSCEPQWDQSVLSRLRNKCIFLLLFAFVVICIVQTIQILVIRFKRTRCLVFNTS